MEETLPIVTLFLYNVRKCICQLGQALSPEPKGYVQIRDWFDAIVMEQI